MTPSDSEDARVRLRRLLRSEDETLPELPTGFEPAPPPKPEPEPAPPADPVQTLVPAPIKVEEPAPTPTPTPPAMPASTPLTRPALDQDNMPLPKRVDQIDMAGTRVSRAAYTPPSTGPRAAQARVSTPPPQYVPPPADNPPSRFDLGNFNWRGSMGCFVRGLIVSVFLAVIVGLCLGSIAVYEYYSIASTLPDVEGLKDRASQFETTRILDRNGNLLYEILDPNAGRRTYIPLSKISPNLVAATIATEDRDFYSHPGFDFWAIVRALWQNYVTGGQGGGASTITQQLARALLLSPEERTQRTVTRKAREIILAAEITRRYSKDEILELYLNEIYYGNLAYGIQAASETYFGKSADQLTLGEASFLAGLPQSPAVYDIYTSRDITLARHQQVLVLMYEASQSGCIAVSNSPTPVCVDAVSVTGAADAIINYTFQSPDIDTRYPHWVTYVRSLLEEQYDAQTIYRSGFTIYTSLDPTLQDEAQRLVTEQVATLVDKNARNGALVAIRPSTGEILAMVGSPDFYNDAIAGQVNMATSPTRQPGSSIKPITYVAAFEKGWTPATLIWDVPSEFPPSGNPDDTRDPYIPVNYDGRSHGPVTVRVALSNSFNIPAVKALDFISVYGQGGMVEMAKRLGITSLTRDDYGLALTLGGGDVSLLEMTGAFSVFANGGQRVPPVAILKITDYAGNPIYEYKPEPGEQALRAEHAYLISSILSDNESRSWMFGRNSVLSLPFPAAAKTGTTNDFRDNWTMGYTPDLVTGVWIGNADYTPMVNTTGLTGAAPIWSQFMTFAVPYITNNNPSPFVRPPGVVDYVVCALSGTQPSNTCKQQYSEVFASDQLPLPAGQDLLRRINLDTWTLLEASEACKDFTESENVLNVTDPWARRWLDGGEGRDWLENHNLPRNPLYAPERECRADDPHPEINLALEDGQVITSPILEIKGTADATGYFESWRLEIGLGADPNNWVVLNGGGSPVRNGLLHMVDLSSLENGIVTLRLTVTGKYGEVTKSVRLNLNMPTPTVPPTLTPTTTPTPPPTDTPPPPSTDVPPPTDTPPPTQIDETPIPPTEEPPPSETPTPVEIPLVE
ncbi:MAG: transglycosylase domain-containing protein [Chloroflexi bacterium]|nr:transglycosylase domain-containing protein [Chloroflexota bacterium]